MRTQSDAGSNRRRIQPVSKSARIREPSLLPWTHIILHLPIKIDKHHIFPTGDSLPLLTFARVPSWATHPFPTRGYIHQTLLPVRWASRRNDPAGRIVIMLRLSESGWWYSDFHRYLPLGVWSSVLPTFWVCPFDLSVQLWTWCFTEGKFGFFLFFGFEGWFVLFWLGYGDATFLPLRFHCWQEPTRLFNIFTYLQVSLSPISSWSSDINERIEEMSYSRGEVKTPCNVLTWSLRCQRFSVWWPPLAMMVVLTWPPCKM